MPTAGRTLQHSAVRRRHLIRLTVLLALAVFLAWRFVRPMNIFVVADVIPTPVSTATLPAGIENLRAEAAVNITPKSDEWRTSMHSRAWTGAYFQVDWRHDRAQQICKN